LKKKKKEKQKKPKLNMQIMLKNKKSTKNLFQKQEHQMKDQMIKNGKI